MIENSEIKETIEKSFSEQREMIDALTRQISELQFNIETLKKNQEDLINYQPSIEEIKEENKIIPIESPVIEEEEKIVVDFDGIYKECFINFSESNKGLAMKTMKMWFQNIFANPEDKQKARINITNPQYKNYFAGNPAADKLFEIVGFQVKGNFLEFDSKNSENLKNMLDKITDGISSLPLQVFSNSAP